MSVLLCIWNGPLCSGLWKTTEAPSWKSVIIQLGASNHEWSMSVHSMIWDSFVTSPIKHDQLNIFALNVCHGVPVWTVEKLRSRCGKGSTERSNFVWVVTGKKVTLLYISASLPCIKLKGLFNSPRQLLRINMCPNLKYATKQRLMTYKIAG